MIHHQVDGIAGTPICTRALEKKNSNSFYYGPMTEASSRSHSVAPTSCEGGRILPRHLAFSWGSCTLQQLSPTLPQGSSSARKLSRNVGAKVAAPGSAPLLSRNASQATHPTANPEPAAGRLLESPLSRTPPLPLTHHPPTASRRRGPSSCRAGAASLARAHLGTSPAQGILSKAARALPYPTKPIFCAQTIHQQKPRCCQQQGNQDFIYMSQAVRSVSKPCETDLSENSSKFLPSSG